MKKTDPTHPGAAGHAGAAGLRLVPVGIALWPVLLLHAGMAGSSVMGFSAGGYPTLDA